FYVQASPQLAGAASALMVPSLAPSLALAMNTATADGSRALYGIARDDMTVKQLYHLNRYRVPSRAMTVDMIVNLLLVFFLGNTLAILVAGNLGYILAHFFALTGFLLLRKDRPNWPRPIRVNNVWLPIAAVLAIANLLFVIYGVTNPDITGYGTFRELLIGVGVLLVSVLLYLFRRIIQDKRSIVLREETPAMPAAEAGAGKGQKDRRAGKTGKRVPPKPPSVRGCMEGKNVGVRHLPHHTGAPPAALIAATRRSR